MEVTLGVCPCQKKKKEAWDLFAKYLEENLNVKVNLVFFDSPEEEFKDESYKNFDIIYSVFPVSTSIFYHQKFVPFARFEFPNEEKYYLVGNFTLSELKQKKKIKVGIYNHPSYYGIIIPLEFHYNLKLDNLWIFTADSYDKLLDNLKKGLTDLIIIPEHLVENKSFTLKTPLVIRRRQYFMIAPWLEDRFQEIEEVFLKTPQEILDALGAIKVVPVTLWERINIFSFACFSKYIFDFWEKSLISDVLLDSPYFGIAIYQDKFVYVNEYMCNALGYTKEEFLQLSPIDL
ncbi:MAG: hypothetical protein GXO57_04715, partial [Thermodesulfobacteria bacterium]|nr:hypothetical protein [Thermodesulfobacteriota bacterium]